MKKCTYCGQEYSDEDSVCSIDRTPLESCDPKSPSLPARDEQKKSFATAEKIAVTQKEPDGFRSYGKCSPVRADRLLKKFEAAGVRFQIKSGHRRVIDDAYMVFGAEYYVTRDFIEIFVNNDDDEKALKILNEDWKV